MEYLKINERYGITTDQYQFILSEKRIAGDDSKTPGEEIWRGISYHTSLTDLITKVAKLNILENWPDLEKIIRLNEELLDYVQEIDSKLASIGV